MVQTFAENARSRYSGVCMLLLCALALFGTSLASCNNACFIFTSNPPTGSINVKAGDPKPACTLTRASGAVRVVLETIPMCRSCSDSARIQHAFVSIQGIDIHASATADDESSDWQALLPRLAKQPLQVDLMEAAADRGSREPLGEVVEVPAGIYRQLRMRFVPNAPAAEDRLLKENACANTGSSCVVAADGTIHPLLFDATSPELRITPEGIVGGSLLVFPDTDRYLVIEMKPVWTWLASANRDVRLLPVLTAHAKVERVGFDEVRTPAGKIDRGPLSR